MIRSMTGFARRERPGDWGMLICELRAVNHRYLDLSLRVPEELRGAENDAREALGKRLRRGKVDAGVYLRGATASVPKRATVGDWEESLLPSPASFSYSLARPKSWAQ